MGPAGHGTGTAAQRQSTARLVISCAGNATDYPSRAVDPDNFMKQLRGFLGG